MTRVLVHVGAPKTGTSFVQDLLFQQREQLAQRGVLYPADRFDEHFLAALDLMELPWGGLEKQAVGAWDRLAARVRDFDGTAIVSHEILATASRQQVRRALASFGDSEVHVVMSARDLVRQIPAEWQENVKHRRTLSYRDFLDRIGDPARTGKLASWFWGVQDVPAVLDRWGADLPPSQVHLVTVPKPGAPRDLLWHRFAEVFDLDPADHPTTTDRANASLGVPEVALVRRINEQVNGVVANEHYREFVRELLAHQTLSRREGSARIGLAPEVRDWAVGICEEWVKVLEGRGYDVVGTLDDLVPDADPTPYVDPDVPDEAEVADAALSATVALIKETARLRGETADLRHELHVVREQELGGSTWLRAKRKVVRSAENNRVGRAALGVYRRLR